MSVFKTKCNKKGQKLAISYKATPAKGKIIIFVRDTLHGGGYHIVARWRYCQWNGFCACLSFRNFSASKRKQKPFNSLGYQHFSWSRKVFCTFIMSTSKIIWNFIFRVISEAFQQVLCHFQQLHFFIVIYVQHSLL